jgi:Ferritin-like domain
MLAGGLGGGCTGGSAPPVPAPTTTATTTPPGTDQPSGDLAVALLGASLENTLAAAYGSLLDLASAGKLGTPPAAVTTLLQTVASHHRDHATAWNAILSGAGAKATTGPDTTLLSTVVQPGLPTVKDTASLVLLALQLERIAAATYLEALQRQLTTTGALETAAAIQPVEMQHIAVFSLFAGSYPVPDSFATSSGARTTTDQLG